jgi:hypothetical protein
MMRVYQGETWGIETAGWSISQDGSCITLCPADVDAALQFSAYRKRAGPITQDELLAELRERVPEGISIDPATCGAFRGWSCDYIDEENGNFWRLWNLCNGETNLFVTYNCGGGHRGDHWEVVDWMLSTLEVELRSRANDAAIRGSEFFKALGSKHPEVELLLDSGYLKGGWSYYWITSRQGSSVRNLVYARVRPGELQVRKYDSSGNALWVDVR